MDWGLGFGCRFGLMRLLLGLLGFWSRQLLSGSGNPRCAVDSAPSAQLLSRLNRSHQLSPFGRALAPVRQQQVSAGHSYPPQLNQPPLLFAAAAATNLRRSHLLASSTLLLGSPSSRARALAPTASPHSRFGFQQTSLSPSHRTTSGPTSAFLRLSQLPLSAGPPSARLQPLNWALDLPASLGLPPPSNLPPIFCRHFWLQWSARAVL